MPPHRTWIEGVPSITLKKVDWDLVKRGRKKMIHRRHARHFMWIKSKLHCLKEESEKKQRGLSSGGDT